MLSSLLFYSPSMISIPAHSTREDIRLRLPIKKRSRKRSSNNENRARRVLSKKKRNASISIDGKSIMAEKNNNKAFHPPFPVFTLTPICSLLTVDCERTSSASAERHRARIATSERRAMFFSVFGLRRFFFQRSVFFFFFRKNDFFFLFLHFFFLSLRASPRP